MPHEDLHLNPVRTPLGWPVSSETLAPFCHPQDGHPFSLPFAIDGITHAANGWLVLRLDRPEPPSFRPEPSPAAAARLARIQPNDWLPRNAPTDPERGWKKLDDKGSAIWKKTGPIPFWTPAAGHRWQACPAPRVIVGSRPVALALIQLIARLPRAEIWTCNPQTVGSIPFRFNGGDGVLAPWKNAFESKTEWHLFGWPKEPDNRLSFGFGR